MSTPERLIPIINAVRLLDAVLCANCEMISDSNGESCSICGSKSLMSMARLLGGSANPLASAPVEPGPEELRNNFTVLVNRSTPARLRRRRPRAGDAPRTPAARP